MTPGDSVVTRLEPVAWPLAFGGASVFVLAVVLDRLPWPLAFGALAMAVAGWAWRGPLVVGVAVIAWLCVTGFDVHRFGYIGMTGSADVLCGVALVLLGTLAGSAHAVVRRCTVTSGPILSRPPSTRPVRSRRRLFSTSNRGMKKMADLAFIVLTVVVFALFGLVVKVVERL